MPKSEEKLKEARKELSKARGSWFGRDDKILEAADNLKAAANLTKSEGNLDKAAALYEELYNIHFTELKDPITAGQNLQDAINIYRTTDPNKAIQSIRKYQEVLEVDGNFRKRNQLYEQLATLYEQQNNLPAAMECYMNAGNGLKVENQPIIANKSLEKYGELLATLEQKPDDYIRARDVFLDIARFNMTNNTLKFSTKNALFKAGLCSLAFGDVVTVHKDYNEFLAIDKSLPQQREWGLLQELVEALDAKDPDMWAASVNAFARTFPLQLWHETIIGRIEDNMRAAEDDFS